MSRDKHGFKRIGQSELVCGLKFLGDGKRAIEERAYRAATLLLWTARDYFTRSGSVDAPGYRREAQELLDVAQAELQKELAGNV